LDRISIAVTRIGRDQLFSVDKGSVRFPLNVYSRPGGSNLSLSTFYLTSCSEAELGLVHRYISAFKGKLENQDPLALVLNRDSKGLTELSNRSISAVEGLSASAEVQQHTLSSLVINKSPDRWTVTFTFLDANDENWMGKDSYQLNNGILQLIEKGLVEKL
jgi:hypothetical protein